MTKNRAIKFATEIDPDEVSKRNPEGTWGSYLKTKQIMTAERAYEAGVRNCNTAAMILLRTIVSEAERTGSWSIAPDLQERALAIVRGTYEQTIFLSNWS